MRGLIILALATFAVQQCVAPPVTQTKDEEKDKEHAVEEDPKDTENAMEYHRYLDEVVQALESDPEFRKKLEKADEADIRSGKIAHELDFVNYHVRTELDELKRTELERLRHLATQRFEMENDLDMDHLKMAEHVDHSNPHTFEVNDLKKLIAKTTEDLAKADRKRRMQFKEYEMEKKFEQEEKMKKMNEEEKKKYAEELKALEEKHKQHKPLHHPGSEPQLKEVWEEQDHMTSQEFDPRTFFYLHDVDGNGVWDQDEVKALFVKELDKLSAQGMPKADLRERQEEMERMREHVFKEADVNNDWLISYKEFLEQTKKPEFQKDEGWTPLDEQQIYSQQEYEEFERKRQEQMQRLIAKGILPPHQASYDPGHPQQFPPQYGNIPVDQQHQGQMPLPAQFPDHLQGQVPPQQHFQGQAPPQHIQQQQQFQGHQQVPQYQGQPPQHYEQQQFQGHQQVQQNQGHQQVPQYQGQQQVPQYQGQQQVPQYQGQQQVPQYQAHPVQNQVPVQQGQVPVEHRQVPVQQGQAPVQHGQVPVQQHQQAQHSVDKAQEQHHETSGQQKQQEQHQNKLAHASAQGQAQQHEQHAQAQNNQAHHQAGQDQVPAAGHSAKAAPSPNAVKT